MNRVKKGSLALSGFYNDTPTERAASSLSLSIFNCSALCHLQHFLPPLVGIMQERRHQMIGNSPILTVPPYPRKSPGCWAHKSVKSVKTQQSSQSVTSSTVSTHTLTNKMLSEVSRSNTRKYSPNNEHEIQYVGEPIKRRAARTQ